LPEELKDERKRLEIMWSHIFGLIIADAGYVEEFGEKVRKLGKQILTGVRKNMRKP